MRPRRRQQVTTIFAILAALVVASKVIKGVWRGETIQARVRPVN